VFPALPVVQFIDIQAVPSHLIPIPAMPANCVSKGGSQAVRVIEVKADAELVNLRGVNSPSVA
jgi:hypothetical protein